MDTKTKSKTAIIRGRAKKQTNEPTPIPIQQQSPSHTYATIERDISLDRASFATAIVDSTTQIASSMNTVNTTPKKSTFKRIQSLFRPSPSMFFNKQNEKIFIFFSYFSINKFSTNQSSFAN